MPKFIHDRAEHLLAKNPSMNKSMAFAIATQQSHALGKSPKGYGTAEGKREAKQKFSTPKDDKKTANPGSLNSPKLASTLFSAFVDEYQKLGFQTSQYSGPLGSGTMRYHSMIPSWHEPPVKNTTPDGKQKQASNTSELRPPPTGGGLTPVGRLRSAQGVGKPRVTAPPGPSIAQISKPVGFGKPLPGALKTGL